LAGFGSMLGLAFLSWLIFNNLFTVAFTALIFAVVPYTVFFDRMALADSLLAMFGVWSLVLAILFSKTKKLEHAMFLGFAIGGGLITKSPAIIFYVWTLLSLIFFGGLYSKGRLHLKKIIIGLLAVIVISQGINSILRLGPGFSQIGSRNLDYVFSFKEVLTHPLNPFIGNAKTTLSWFWLLLTPTILFSIIISFFNCKLRKEILFLILVSFIPLIGQASIAKVYTSRYALYAILPLLPLAGMGLSWLMKRVGLLIKISIIFLILVPAIISGIYIYKPDIAPMSYDMRSGYLEEWTAGWGQKDIANYLIDQESKGNKIVVFTEGYFGTLPDGLQIYTEGHKDIVIVGSNYNVTSIPEGLLNTSTENLRFFVLNKSRNHLKESDLSKLQLIKEYEKPSRLDGSNEALQFYRLK